MEKMTLWLLVIVLWAQAGLSGEAARPIPVPTPAQYRWHEQERIMFVHLSPATWQGVEHDNLSTPLDRITLPKLDTDQWCEAAVAWGAQEVLFVAKHSGGFCWWPTDTNEYGVRNAAWKNGKGDLLEEVAKSCRKYGLNLGVYIYPGDRSLGIGGGGRARDPGKQEAYNQIFRQQLREALGIAAKHARVTEVWFDGSCAVEIGDILKEQAPEAVVFQGPQASIRWVGNEAGTLEYAQSWSTLGRKDLVSGTATARHSDPDGEVWAPLEVNSRLYLRNWFWAPQNEATRKGLDELMRFYYESAGQGAVMLLNSTPNTDGLIPEGDVKLYRALGEEIERRFGKPLKETQGRGEVVELDLGAPTMINHAIIMEDYRQGERIRRYVLEGFDGREWKVLSEGAHVGRKRIECFDESIVSKLRLRITRSAAEPLIRSFQAFYVTSFRLAASQPLRSPWKQCGSWQARDFKNGKAALNLKLTPAITEAGQWEVWFQPVGRGALTLKEPRMIEEGVPAPTGMITRAEGRANALHLTRAASVTRETDIVLHVVLEGPASDGVIQVRQVPH